MTVQQKRERRIKVFSYLYRVMTLQTDMAQAQKDAFESGEFSTEELSIIDSASTNFEEIKETISKNLKTGWSWVRLASVDRAILWTAMAEKKAWNTDKPVVINEYVRITKEYGSDDDTFKLVNAILDKVI